MGMGKRKMFLQILVLLLFCNCNSEKRNTYEIMSMTEINLITDLLQNKPPNGVNPAFRIYILDENKLLRCVNFNYLKALYNIDYNLHQKSLNDFIFNVVNQNIKLEDNDFTNKMYGCELDPKICTLYNQYDIDGLQKKFCYFDISKNKYILKVPNLTQCQLETISYFNFINKYFRINNDAANQISFIRKDLYKFYPKGADMCSGR